MSVPEHPSVRLMLVGGILFTLAFVVGPPVAYVIICTMLGIDPNGGPR